MRFTRWLTRTFYREAGRAPSAHALTHARATIAAMAAFDGPELPVFVRVAGHEGALYLDLCNEGWEVAEIAASGWRVLPSKPYRCGSCAGTTRRRCRIRVPGGSLEDLKPLLNVRGEEGFRLLVGWLVGALKPDAPYPVLVLQGEQGWAKSTAVRVLRAVVDPPGAPASEPT